MSEIREQLAAELVAAKEMQYAIFDKRKWKVLIRWVLGAIFYYILWDYSWARLMFWISVPLELILLLFSTLSYTRLSAKIKVLEDELASS